MQNKLEKILNAKSIAIIGASNREGSVGNELVKRVLEFSYKGAIYPIHPSDKEIMGIKAYAHIGDVKKPIDMAIIAVPAKVVLGVVDECNLANVKNLVVITSGFREIGGEGAELEKQLQAKIKKYKMNMVGPNSVGTINANKNVSLDSSFTPLIPVRGKMGFATQSGALGAGTINILPSLGIGMSQMVSLGNQTDIDALDVIEYWENNDDVSQILLYLESIENPKEFRKVVSRVVKKKPVIAIKSGRSAMGAKATASHTGSLAGSDKAADALLASCGVVREIKLGDMFNTAQILGNCTLPAGRRLGILTNAGGPGILATDSAEENGLQVVALSETTREKIKKIVLPQASTANPVDIIASASCEHYQKTAEIMMKSGEIDMLLVIYLYITGKNDINVLADLEKLKKKYPDKPIASVFMTTQDFRDRISTVLQKCSVPVYTFVDDAIRGLRLLCERKEYLEQSAQKTPVFKVDKEKVSNIISKAESEGIKQLSTLQSLQIFEAYGLPIPKYVGAQNIDDAKRFTKKYGFPVVLKMSSKKVSHKTDVGGVVLNINSERELVSEWKSLVNRLTKAGIADSLDSIVVMQQVKGKREIVVGAVEQGNYGHQIMFGIGGIFIEVFKEVMFRPCPLTIGDAKALIKGTKAGALVKDVRGEKEVSNEVLIETLLRFSQLVTDFPNILEIDANPIMINGQGELFTVDARVNLK